MSNNLPNPKKIINALNGQVTSAWSHLYAWRQIGRFFLQRPELGKGAEGFVRLCLNAHIEAALLDVSILLEKPGRHSGVNIGYLLNTIESIRGQCPSIGAEAILSMLRQDRELLDSLRSQLDGLRGWRDQYIAHLDKSVVVSETPPQHTVLAGVLRDAIKKCHGIIQSYNGHYYDTLRVAVQVGYDDFNVIGRLLEIGYDRHRELVLEASERAKDKPHVDMFADIDGLAWERQGRLTAIQEADEERLAWEWRGHPE